MFQLKIFSILCQVKVLVMSASANKLSKFKQEAATYAALIMEELDPDNQGYVEVQHFHAISLGYVEVQDLISLS